MVAGPLAFLALQLFFSSVGLSDAGVSVLAVTSWMAIWWITEAIPIEATSLLPLILFPLLSVADIGETGASYGHKFIFLFLGGFMIALAIEKWGLHRRIALYIIHFVGTSLSRVVLGFMISTAFLSMWISNTATTVMLLPIGMAVVGKLNENLEDSIKGSFQKALMLSIAFSASIGGMATLVGTPPNLIFAGVVEELYNIEISFFQWFIFGLPISVLLLAITWLVLTRYVYRLKDIELKGGSDIIKREISELGKIGKQEIIVLSVFSLTALAWVCRSFFLSDYVPGLDDSIIALIGALLLFVLPSGDIDRPLLAWQDLTRLPWGVLLLFGGGIALAMGFQSSGLAEWIGVQLSGLQGIHAFFLILTVVATVNFMTEVTSNIATTSILLPILSAMAVTVGVHPFVLLGGATVAASCAFMLPVATAPNALVFGSGMIEMKDMIRAGIWLNLISIILLSIIVYYLLPVLWGV
ncbi:MAG: SLC13 family permease [Candidatus Kapaibacteriales bacterium]